MQVGESDECITGSAVVLRELDVATLRKFPNSNFKQPSACVLAPPREVGF
jgi:hypothetical protein